MLKRIVTALLAAFLSAAPAFHGAAAQTLPQRGAPIPATTGGVPHMQIGVTPVPEISAEMLRRVAQIPGVQLRPTVVSQRGATGFWLSEELALARPDVIVGGREFAHLHPDGSLHASLPPDLAARAIAAGWAVAHPWAHQRPGWEGFVMIYTPQNWDELDIVMQLIRGGYAFVTGLE